MNKLKSHLNHNDLYQLAGSINACQTMERLRCNNKHIHILNSNASDINSFKCHRTCPDFKL
jgi:hypothetical protein